MNHEALYARLGYRFERPELLNEALTHRSFGTPNYERLEFLGDSVLNCVIAHALFDRFPALPEGQLSRLRAALVREASLHRVALSLDLGNLLRMGEGELKSGGFTRPSILADAFEAVCGAITLDAGFDTAASVVRALFESELAALNPAQSQKDPKTELQEWLQARRAELPVYQLIEVAGQAHSQHFKVECQVRSFKISTCGEGTSRRAAEQDAAQLALAKLQQTS